MKTSGVKKIRPALIETYTMNEQELGEYCRKHGLYSTDVKRWHRIFDSSFNAKRPSEGLEQELKAQKDENKRLTKELEYKEKAMAEAAALLVLKKRQTQFGGPRGRMISAEDRQNVIGLINEAREGGARLEPACEVVGISARTYQRWVKQGPDSRDKRPSAKRKAPANKLSEEERSEVPRSM